MLDYSAALRHSATDQGLPELSLLARSSSPFGWGPKVYLGRYLFEMAYSSLLYQLASDFCFSVETITVLAYSTSPLDHRVNAQLGRRMLEAGLQYFFLPYGPRT